jgi:tRNA wybutosine-synthesizing protein 3
MTFENQKKIFFSKLDKSRKGHIDREVIPLIKKINKNKNYYTTSSCSGRIAVILAGKKPAKWIFVSHKPITFKQIKSIKLPKKDIWLKQEPFIMHIACKSLEHAQKILNKARSVGFKRSGIQSIRKNIIEITETEHINTLIAEKGKLLIDDNYLKKLIKTANKKLKETRQKIKRFQKKI